MTTPNGTAADQVEGVIETRNDHGIRIDGQWHNVSKFKPVDLPDRGARVRVSLDAKAFIRSIEVLDGAPATTSSSPSSRDRAIARMSALRSAAIFAGGYAQSREDVKSADVLKIAEAWLRWLEKPESEEEGEQF